MIEAFSFRSVVQVVEFPIAGAGVSIFSICVSSTIFSKKDMAGQDTRGTFPLRHPVIKNSYRGVRPLGRHGQGRCRRG